MKLKEFEVGMVYSYSFIKSVSNRPKVQEYNEYGEDMMLGCSAIHIRYMTGSIITDIWFIAYSVTIGIDYKCVYKE